MFVARKADNIEADIKRNWSSWNFGTEGFEGTREELDNALSELSEEKDNYLWVSGFEVRENDRKSYEFGELYSNYWVVIDRVNARNGLSCLILDAENLEDAISEATIRTDYWGDGDSFDASEATLVYSKGDIHVFEIED